jgi:hypothetical protein
VIQRKTRIGKKEYEQMLLYIPKELVGDSAFPLKVGSPCEITIDMKDKKVIVSPISEERAREKGWARRERKKSG